MKRKIAMMLSMALVLVSAPVNRITGFAEEIIIEESTNESVIAEEAEVGQESESLLVEETEMWLETENMTPEGTEGGQEPDSLEPLESLVETEPMTSVDMTESLDNEQESIDSNMILVDVSEDEAEWGMEETFGNMEGVEVGSETESILNKEIEILNIQELDYSATEKTAAEQQAAVVGIEFADLEKYNAVIMDVNNDSFDEKIALLVKYSNGSKEVIHFLDVEEPKEDIYVPIAIDRFGNIARYRLFYTDSDGSIEETYYSPGVPGIWTLEVTMAGFKIQTEIEVMAIEQAMQSMPKLNLDQENIVSVNGTTSEGFAVFEAPETGTYVFSSAAIDGFFVSLSLYNIEGSLVAWDFKVVLNAEQGEKYMLFFRTGAPQVPVYVQKKSTVTSVKIKGMETINAFRLHDELYHTAVTVYYADGRTEDLVDNCYYMQTNRGNLIIGEIWDQSQNKLDIEPHFDEIEYGDIPLGTYELVLREQDNQQIVGKKSFTIAPEASEIVNDFEGKVSVEKGKPIVYKFTPTNETEGDYKFYCFGNASDIHLVAYCYDETKHKLIPLTFACGRDGQAELEYYFASGTTYYLVAEQVYSEALDSFAIGFGDINATPHTHTWKTEKVEATCESNGYIKYVCTTCSEEKTEVIKAKGHNFSGVFTVDKESTCTVAGSKSRKCSRCSAVERVALPLKAHQMINVIDRQPTCGSAGSQHQECSVCHTKGMVSTLPATEKHQWGNWSTVSAATVFEAESRQHKCGVCGKTEVQKNGVKLSPTMKVSATSVPLKVKQKTTKVTVSDLAAGDYVKSWKSSNKKIVKVNGEGKLTAGKKTGKAVVTVTLASGLKKDIKVTVQKEAVKTKKIKGVPKKLSMKVKRTYDLAPVISPITSQDKIKYTTSNKKVATVNSKGKIKAKKKGSAVITIKCGSKSVKCKVKVK